MEKNNAVFKLRMKLGYSQEQFAELLDVHRVTIGNWENGRALNHHVLKLCEIALNPKRFIVPYDQRIITNKGNLKWSRKL